MGIKQNNKLYNHFSQDIKHVISMRRLAKSKLQCSHYPYSFGAHEIFIIFL